MINSLTTKIVFGRDRHPELEYTDLSKEFPGYSFIECGEDKHSHNMYKGEDAGFGGYVWVDPGMYTDVALLDVSSMHPHSILAMNCFGEYTQRFRDIVDARIAIKHKDYAKVKTMLDGALEPFVENDEQADILSTALKIPINSVYGLTSAKFDNPFRDPRNVNNIVALRGALFMITLKEKIIEMGYKPIHFKTDSVKIANADQKIIDFCMDFARKYGYEFEHEATYSKICIVNGSTYIAKYDNFGQRNKGGKHANEWTATAAQFQHPYVFKKLFSKEPITVEDLVEVKEVKGTLYLDLNEGLPNVKELEKARTLWEKVDEDPSKELSKKDSELLANIKEQFADISKLGKAIDEGHSYKFVGKIGEFCPVLPGTNGGELMRFDNDKYSYATGAKDYRWKEADDIRQKGLEDEIDMGYFNKLVDEAVTDISEYGDFEWFAEEKEN